MNIRASLALVISALALGCSASQPSPDASSPTPTTTVTVAPPPSETAGTSPPEQKPPETAPEPTPEVKPAEGGRVAFQGCTEETRKVKGCTKDLKPVCGEVDTGIRCIRAPCPSSVQKTFSNPCLACQDAKVNGYWPMACESMTKQPEPGAPVQ